MNDKTIRAQIEIAKSAMRLLKQYVENAEAGKPQHTTLTEIGEGLAHDNAAILAGTSRMLEYVA